MLVADRAVHLLILMPMRAKPVLTILLLLTMAVGHTQTPSPLCAELDFYWNQLATDCKGIAGSLISTVKEYRTRRVLTGMLRGQCSGSQPYTNDFVKFYSSLLTPAQADSAWQQWRYAFLSCFTTGGWAKLADAELDPTMRQMRWENRQPHHSQVVILEEKPDADLEGLVITVELIRTAF